MQEHVNQQPVQLSVGLDAQDQEGSEGLQTKSAPALQLSASSRFDMAARGPIQMQDNDRNEYFRNLAREVFAIIEAAPRRNSELQGVFERLNNDSDHIQRLRAAYYGLYRKNLIHAVVFLTPPASIRFDPTGFARYKIRLLNLLNLTYDQALMHAHGEINKINDEREALHNFERVEGAARADIDADGRTDDGREEIMGVRATERDNIPIRGETTLTYFNINSTPTWNSRNVVLGQMDGTNIPVTVLDKALFPDGGAHSHFYKVRFQDPAKFRALTAGKRQQLESKQASGNISSQESYALELLNQGTGWIVGGGIDMAIPWELFMRQLWSFDAAYADKSLKERVTILRQMAHAKNLPFDDVIGSGSGDMYVDTRPDMGGLFQLLKDSGRVQIPTGEVVDIYHAIVGMDVLYRPIEDHSISQFGYSVEVGQNYSAATWAGDIGAAAVDAALAVDEQWEGRNTSGLSGVELNGARLSHYFDTRAPEADLWGNIDAWGMAGSVANAPAPTTVTALMLNYYGQPTDQGDTAADGRFAGKRKQALTAFLKHYGARSIETLPTDILPVLREQISIFANTWDLYRRGVGAAWDRLRGNELPDLATYEHAMAVVFASWLQRQARNYNVQF